MVCCDEFLDPHAEEILKKMFPNVGKNAPNQWVDNKVNSKVNIPIQVVNQQ